MIDSFLRLLLHSQAVWNFELIRSQSQLLCRTEVAEKLCHLRLFKILLADQHCWQSRKQVVDIIFTLSPVEHRYIVIWTT